jgi:enamine deaminase RidA (YjgF/YER057c/UK114 family)
MKILNPDGIYHSSRYASGIRAGNTIYTAGRVPIDVDGNVVAPNDARAQTEHILESLKLILAEGGATLQDVVHVRTYRLRSEDMPTIFEVLHRYLEHRPPHTGVNMESEYWEESGIRLEIEVTAVVEE